MSIKEDFATYVDGNGLMAPEPVTTGTMRASDNGPMFSSEYIIMLLRNVAYSTKDTAMYQAAINSCIGNDKELHRAPGDTSPDEVDDYYAAYSAHVILGIVPQFKLPFRLWRQPQLLYASLCASRSIEVVLLLPLAFITALVIATSCINKETSDTDARRLSWHLIQATSPHSLLCRFAAKLWYKRLHKDYGIDGMKAVAGQYYLPHGLNANPYSKYWLE